MRTSIVTQGDVVAMGAGHIEWIKGAFDVA